MVVVIIQLRKENEVIGITEEVYRVKVKRTKLGKIERMRLVEVERTKSVEVMTASLEVWLVKVYGRRQRGQSSGVKDQRARPTEIERFRLVDVEKSNSGEVKSQCLGEVEFRQSREDEID